MTSARLVNLFIFDQLHFDNISYSLYNRMVHVGLCILVILDTDSELGVIGGGYKSIRPELAHNLFE